MGDEVNAVVFEACLVVECVVEYVLSVGDGEGFLDIVDEAELELLPSLEFVNVTSSCRL